MSHPNSGGDHSPARCLRHLVTLSPCHLVILLAVGCNQPSTPAPGTPAAAPPAGPVTVQVVHPARKSLVRVVEQPGTVLPFEETQLYARVPGYVSAVLADIGKQVRGPGKDPMTGAAVAGEALAEIDVPELREELKQKKALVRQAE